MLYDRDYTITIDMVQIRALRCVFSVKRTLKSQANTVDLKVYNLNPTHRQSIAALTSATVQIDAGYVGQTSTIFLGDLRSHETRREGADLVTQLGAGDGEKAIQTKRVSQSLGKGSTPTQVLTALATALGVDPGNIGLALPKLAPFGSMFSLGTVLSGSASREMTRVLRSVGYTWSIQNGKLQILGVREALAGTAVLLSAQNGLLDSPSIDKDGALNARSLMIPDMFPGRLLVLQAENLSGNFRVDETEHKGDTHSQTPWDITIKAKKF